MNKKIITSLTVVGILVILSIFLVMFIIVNDANLRVQEEDLEFAMIEGYVHDIDLESNKFNLSWYNEHRVEEGGVMMTRRIDQGNILITWEGDIGPHHPSMIQEGDRVRVVPRYVWDELEGNEEIIIESLEIVLEE